MEHCMVKTGACSLVIGKGHYKNYFMEKKGKLMKITKTTHHHNEFKNLNIVRTIDNYEKYFSIPDEASILINPSEPFYEYAKKLSDNASFFYGSMECLYMDYGGNKDMIDSLNDITRFHDLSFWSSYNKILKFTKHILLGLSFLHEHKMCHLDIKPENIVLNTRTRKFKIIDFGFSSIEPFQDYISNTRGTPSYFPQYIPTEKVTPWLPKVEANDMIHPVPILTNPKLVYKIDSYCFGRVLFFLKYLYDDNRVYEFFNYEKKKGLKISSIISDLTENDVHQRITIHQCLNKYFSK